MEGEGLKAVARGWSGPRAVEMEVRKSARGLEEGLEALFRERRFAMVGYRW